MVQLANTIFLLEVEDTKQGIGITAHKTRRGAAVEACEVMHTDNGLPNDVRVLIASNQLADAINLWNALRPNIGKISINEVILME